MQLWLYDKSKIFILVRTDTPPVYSHLLFNLGTRSTPVYSHLLFNLETQSNTKRAEQPMLLVLLLRTRIWRVQQHKGCLSGAILYHIFNTR